MEPLKPIEYYSKETLDILKTMIPSAETLHKIMNPLCGICMAKRGRLWLQSHS